MDTQQEFHARGKLLLLGEYFVLDGGTALAVPTQRGQRFTVKPTTGAESTLRWTMTFEGETPAEEYTLQREDWETSPPEVPDARSRLIQLFHAAEALRAGSTDKVTGKHVTSVLEFDPDWGLGSSSTLVWFLAKWLDLNPYALLEATFGGSGYDLACADAEGPLLYRRDGHDPYVNEIDWQPDWLGTTCFVHLNRKQNSREAIARYESSDLDEETLWEASQLPRLFLQAPHLRSAARIATEYERLVADHLGLKPVKEQHFSDFDGAVKSLGAWGGDFVWAITDQPLEKSRAYFNDRGYGTVIPYNDMVL